MAIKNGIIETYHGDSNNIYTRIEYVDNIKNGIYEVYDINGNLLLKTYYKNNMKNGDFINYYPDSNLIKLKTTFINDKINGNKISYFPNGKIHEICYYNDDLPCGQYKKYHESGKLIETSFWNYGKRTSFYKMVQNEFIDKVYPELIQMTWHPNRVMDWCLSGEDF